MKYILWDFDETLAYREGKWAQAMAELLEQEADVSIEISEIRNRLQTGFPWHHHDKHQSELLNGKSFWEYMGTLFEKAFESLGVSEQAALKLSPKVKDQFLDSTKWNVYEDVIPTLAAVNDAGYQNIIVSNHVPELNELATKLGLSNYFVRIVSSGIVGYSKPHPRIFEIALQDFHDCKQAIMIGDNYSADVIGAANARLECVLVRSDNKFGHKHHKSDLWGLNDYLNNHFPA